MSGKYPKIVLKKGKDTALRRFHPWVFSGAVAKTDSGIITGQIVSVMSNEGDFLGIGFYQDSSITVKILSFKNTEINRNFWTDKLLNAFNIRETIGLTDNQYTNVYRLVNGEGDGLPGLIIDLYNNQAVIQVHNAGYNQYVNEIIDAVRDIYKDKTISVIVKDTSEKAGDFILHDSKDNDQLTVVHENGYLFYVDCIGGQKTGFFIDQRDNRKLIQNYSSGRKMLNLYSYSGSFTVYSMKAGAVSGEQVDSSQKAIDLAGKNLKINEINDNIVKSYVTDVQLFIKDISGRYDLIIIDPPAFAKHLSAKNQALQAYRWLNESAIRQINKNGIIFTFSCSQVINRQLFESAIMSAAIDSGRQVRILHRLSQPPDHPVNIYHPEGEYLKGLVLEIYN